MATGFQQRTIYHSTQRPGYTCWSCLWKMPDGALYLKLLQITDPRPAGRRKEPRPKADAAKLRELGWYERMDMTGLKKELMILRSPDGGKTWPLFATEPFPGMMNDSGFFTALPLKHGSLLRTLAGWYWHESGWPPTGLLQESVDDGKTWRRPRAYFDAAKRYSHPIRLRRLRDGRIVLVCNMVELRPGLDTRHKRYPWAAEVMMLSNDEGKTWSEPVVVDPHDRGLVGHDESDCVEWPDGDLLFIHRIGVHKRASELEADVKFDHQKLVQTIATPSGAEWKVSGRQDVPIPITGAPYLLWLKEGVAMCVGGDGYWWTADKGKRWQKLSLPGPGYYPQAVQLADGEILCTAHVGGDNTFGSVDQSIVLCRFRLEIRRP